MSQKNRDFFLSFHAPRVDWGDVRGVRGGGKKNTPSAEHEGIFALYLNKTQFSFSSRKCVGKCCKQTWLHQFLCAAGSEKKNHFIILPHKFHFSFSFSPVNFEQNHLSLHSTYYVGASNFRCIRTKRGETNNLLMHIEH